MSTSSKSTPMPSSISKSSPAVSFVLPDLPVTPNNIKIELQSRRSQSFSNSKSNSKNDNTTPSNCNNENAHPNYSNGSGQGSHSSSITKTKSNSKRDRNNQNRNHHHHNPRDSNIRHQRALLATPAALKMTISDTNASHEDHSLMLLPPSQTISESLTALAHSTSRELEVVWDEIGLSPEERADQLTDLLLAFRSACEQKVKSEREVCENYRQMIVDYKEEIRDTSMALKVEADETLLLPRPDPETFSRSSIQQGHNGPLLSLQDEVYTLEVALENIRNVAQVAKKELQRCSDSLVDNHDALGLEIDPKWMDVESDLTRPRIEMFQEKVVELDALVNTRTSAVVQLIRDCQELLDAMRIFDEPQTQQGANSNSNKELDSKIMTSLFKDENKNLRIVSIFPTDTCTGINATTLDDLTRRISELHSEKRRRKAKLGEMGAVISELWEKLHVPNEEQRAFSESINGLGMETLNKGEKEMTRLYQMKEDMMGNLILDCRERVKKLLEETNATPSQRNNFQGMNIDDETLFNDDLLSEHENYISLLTNRLEQMRPLLDMIGKREMVVAERMQYEGFLKDPTRLQQRGAALTKQLMKEEKMSRRIKKDLPKYTDVLTRKLKEWVVNHDEPFLFKGDDYLMIMNRQEIQWQTYKETQAEIKRSKKQQYQEVGVGVKKGMATSSYKSAPLSDKTNSKFGPAGAGAGVEKGNKKALSRPLSRLRGMSRMRDRGGAAGAGARGEKKERSKSVRAGNTSRGKTRGISRPRGMGILSRGRARPVARN
mmetsp:Transcript_21665/g.32929  ORF Transcript_21665/g.32929 Transcript_21665/m.32929 type:complete len:775 (+) Transcript_21665:150-2474(+)|eukprot:CAMPEP_0194124566 /NCGR_PEP_ID=MMETSP0150-20130528/59003_1 /TAXON_ID=122233 /ORGANISM="Chaetoceros debilis, Strain MM31A-1" /LENGTH=774 /DNA_ID=CAMNT_0038818341 /DNA_START=70 /DNA_END=2394 /DNA_ORIENTATION=-